MRRKLADDLMQSNEEYTKLREERDESDAPRETPPRQAPGGRGLSRPELEAWTTEELRDAAGTLDVSGAERMEREALIDALLGAELQAAGRPNPESRS